MIQTTAIIGMGALGLLYADRIVTARGRNGASFILDEERMCRYQERSFTINGEKRDFSMVAATDMEPLEDSEKNIGSPLL